MKRVPLHFPGMQALGRHTAALFVQVANRFDARIMIECQDKVVNGKSMLGLLSLGQDLHNQLTLVADGPDEEKAVATIQELIQNDFKLVDRHT